MKLFQLYPKALAHLTCKSPFVESFTAKTVLRGNPAGSIAPIGRAALGISTLSRP